jgi:uncharacterized membrane protein
MHSAEFRIYNLAPMLWYIASRYVEELLSGKEKITTFVSSVIAWEESKWNESLNIAEESATKHTRYIAGLHLKMKVCEEKHSQRGNIIVHALRVASFLVVTITFISSFCGERQMLKPILEENLDTIKLLTIQI